MAKFGPECPLRGMCVGEIAGAEGGSFEHSRLNKGLIPRWEDRVVYIGECVDVDGGRSELFQGVDFETIEPRVEACEGPKDIEIPSKIPFKKPRIVKVCGALGIGPNVPPWYVEHFRSQQERIRNSGETPEDFNTDK